MTTRSATPATTVGPWLADHLDTDWRPIIEPGRSATDVVGHLKVGDIWVYLAGGFGDSGGDWLQIAYLYACLTPDTGADSFGDDQACGTGAGSRVIEALRAWARHATKPIRFVAIENPDFFKRWTDWDDAVLDYDSDGECWYYPPAPTTATADAVAPTPLTKDSTT